MRLVLKGKSALGLCQGRNPGVAETVEAWRVTATKRDAVTGLVAGRQGPEVSYQGLDHRAL